MFRLPPIGEIATMFSGEVGREILLKAMCSPAIASSQAMAMVDIAGDCVATLISTISHVFASLQDTCPLLSEIPFTDMAKLLTNFNFSNISSDYQLQKFLATQDRYVAPVELILRAEPETRASASGEPEQHTVNRTFQFIPISKVLTNVVLPHDDVWDYMQTYVCSLLQTLSSRGIVIDTIQSPSVTENALLEAEVTLHLRNMHGYIVPLCLQLYFDDVETVNPLGSHATVHNLGCFYWTLKNLPYWFNCDRRCIHTVVLVTTIDLKPCRFAPIWECNL